MKNILGGRDARVGPKDKLDDIGDLRVKVKGFSDCFIATTSKLSRHHKQAELQIILSFMVSGFSSSANWPLFSFTSSFHFHPTMLAGSTSFDSRPTKNYMPKISNHENGVVKVTNDSLARESISRRAFSFSCLRFSLDERWRVWGKCCLIGVV